MAEALLPIADHVWLYPCDDDEDKVQPNVGVIIAGGQTVLVDAGNSPRTARRLLNALDAIQAPPVRYVIYTHHHWDHVFGAMVYGATTVGHDLCRKALIEMAGKPWSHAYIQEEIQRTPAREAGLRALARAIDDWRHFRIIIPEITLSHLLRLHLDDVTVEIRHVGGQHAVDSVVVHVVEARTLFVADCYYPPPLHQRRPDSALDAELIAALVKDDIEIYIDGHGPPRMRDEFARLAQEGRSTNGCG